MSEKQYPKPGTLSAANRALSEENKRLREALGKVRSLANEASWEPKTRLLSLSIEAVIAGIGDAK